MFKKLMMTGAALGLALAPLGAGAASLERSGASVKGENISESAVLPVAGIVAALVFGIIIISDSNAKPVSP